MAKWSVNVSNRWLFAGVFMGRELNLTDFTSNKPVSVDNQGYCVIRPIKLKCSSAILCGKSYERVFSICMLKVGEAFL